MKNRKRRNRILFLFVILLGLSIGFAALSTTLNIEGETKISKNTWSVYWANAIVNPESVNSSNVPVISKVGNDRDNTSISWTADLNKPGDFYEFTFDAVNAGTINAMISNIETNVPNDLPEYIKYSLTYDDGTAIANNHLLAKMVGTPTTEKYRIKVYYDEDIITKNDINNMDSNGVSYNFSLDVTYSQADSNAFIRDKGTFLAGEELNVKIKTLAGNTNVEVSSIDSNIRAIKHSLVEPEASNKQQANIVSVEGTLYPIYMWYDNGTIYWWSIDEKPALNVDAHMSFCRLLSLNDLSGLQDFDVSKVTVLFGAFYDCPSIQNVNDLANWDTSNVRNMGWLFGIQDVLTDAGTNGSLNDLTGLANWDVSKVQTMNQMFINIKSLTNLNGLEDWNTVSLTNMSCMFEQDTSLTSIEALRDWDTSKVTNMYALFWDAYAITSLEPLSDWDTGKVQSFERAFCNCIGLTDLNGIEGFNTSSVTNMIGMFCGCTSIISADLSGYNTSNVTTMEGLFYGCSGLTNLNLSGWNNGKVTTMYIMFYDCSKLANLNLTNFHTNNVTDMTGMFCGCKGLTSLDLSSFNTGKVTSMLFMFNECSKLTTLDISNFDMKNVTTTEAMFQYCGALRNLIMPNNYKRIDVFMYNHMGSFNQESFTIPKSVTYVGNSHIFYNFGNTSFKKFIVEEGSTTLKAIDDLLYSYDGGTLISIPNGKTFTDDTYVMPDSVTTLNTMCFNRTQKINKVVISNNLVIDRYYDDTPSGDSDPVKGNRLNTGIYVYTSVKEYEAKSTNTNYSSYGGCIYNKAGTELISVPVKYTGVLNIKDGATTIGQEAFWVQRVNQITNITEINIPASVTTIEAKQLTTLNKLITNGVVINIDSNNTSYEISNNKIVAK